MKKIKKLLIIALLGAALPIAAYAFTATSTNWTTGSVISSAYLNSVGQTFQQLISSSSAPSANTTVNNASGSITILGAGSTTVSTSGNTITISSPTSSDATASATSSPVFLIAASNAPSFYKTAAFAVCTGASDGTCVQNAYNSIVALGVGGHMLLSPGTFYFGTSTFNPTATSSPFIWLSGSGMGATVIYASSTGIQIGCREICGDPLLQFGLTDFTIYGPTNSTTTAIPIYWDGMGSQSYMNNVSANGGLHAVVVEDDDRGNFNSDQAENSVASPWVNEIGAENTFGKMQISNSSIVLNQPNYAAMDFTYDSAHQSSPNPFSAVTLTNNLYYNNQGLATTTGVEFDVGCTACTINGGQGENNDIHILLNGTSTGGSSLLVSGASFINTNHTSAAIVMASGTQSNDIDLQDDTFQQSNCVWDGLGSGYSNVTFSGQNLNDGNIGNIICGQYASLQGTNTGFVGSELLTSGLQNEDYAYVYTQGINYFIYQPTDLSSDFGAWVNSQYSSSVNSMTFYVSTSTTYSTPISFGTNGKFASIQCAPGVVLTYTGASSTYAITWNDGTEFPKQAHSSSGCSLKDTSSPSASTSPSGIYLGGTHGYRKGLLDGWSIWGFNIGLNFGTNSYNDAFNDGLIENNIQNVNFITYSNSGEDDLLSDDAIVDPANSSSSNCVVLQQSAVSNLTIQDTSLDDCQLVIGSYSVGIVLSGDHFENPAYSTYGSATYAIKIGAAVTVSSYGNVFQQDSNASATAWTAYYNVSSAGNLDDYGDVFEATNGYTLPDAITGSGTWNLFGIHNYIYDPGATYAYASTTFQAIDTSQSGFGSQFASTTFVGSISSTATNALAWWSSAGILTTTSTPSSGFTSANASSGIAITTSTSLLSILNTGVTSLGNTTGSISVGKYLSGGTTLTVSSTLASSTWNFVIQNATTTNNTTNIMEWTVAQAGTITQFACHDTVATTGLYFFEPTSDTTTTPSSTIVGTNYLCGVGGQTTSTSYAFLGGQAFIVEVSSTAGTPVTTPVHIQWTKQ